VSTPRFFLSLSLAGLLAACGGSSDDGNATGELTLQVTDAAVDGALQVVVQFRGIELHGPGGTQTYYYCEDASTGETVLSAAACAHPAPRQLDLLALTDGLTEFLLDGLVTEAGRYAWVRLLVDAEPDVRDSYIVMPDGEHELLVPSGAETGLKLNRGFTVPAGGTADFTIDFDLRKSVHDPLSGGIDYLLRPTLRIVDSAEAGAIAGEVDAALVTDGCTPAVYAYTGAGVTPDDVDGAAPDPVTTAQVKLDEETGLYRYKAAFLEPGDHTVAFTCQAAGDDPAMDDAIVFSGAATVAVAPGTVATHEFQASLP